MMQQRWEALMATVGIDISQWVDNAARWDSELADMDAGWQRFQKSVEAGTHRISDSLISLDERIQLSAKEAAEMDRIFSAYAEFTAKEVIDANERIAKSQAAIRAEQEKSAKIAERDYAAHEVAEAKRAEQELAAATRGVAQAERLATEEHERRQKAVNALWQALLKERDAAEAAERQREDERKRRTQRARELDAQHNRYMENLRERAEHERRIDPLRQANADRRAIEAADQQRQQEHDRRVNRARELDRLHNEYLDGLRREMEHERTLGAVRERNRQARQRAADAEQHAQQVADAQQQRALMRLDLLDDSYHNLSRSAQEAWSRAWKGANAAADATTRVGQATRSSTMFYFEFGRAIEDASIGYSLNGIRGMMMGVSNNLARMAEMAGQFSKGLALWAPHIAVVTSLGVAIYQMFAHAQQGAEDAKAASDEYFESLERNMRQVGDYRRFWIDVEGLETSDQSRAMGRGINANINELDAQVEYLRTARAETERLYVLNSNDARLRDIYGQRLVETDSRINELLSERSMLVQQTHDLLPKHLELLEQETELLEYQRELGRLRLEDELAAARQAADADIRNILDPHGAAIDRLREERSDREFAITQDDTLTTEEVNQRLAQNEEAFRQQLEEMFDVERLDEFNTTLGDMVLNGELTNEQYVAMVNQVEALREQFDAGTISLDEFNNSVEHIDRALEDAAQAAEEAAEAERRAALLRGDFAGAGLDMEQALEDRLAQERMRQWNELVDQQFDMMYGNQDEMEDWRKEMERMQKEAAKAAEAFHQFQGDPDEALGRVWEFINSIEGQIANTQNSIMAMENTLRMFGDDMDALRRQELIQSLDQLTDILNQLYEQQRQQQFITDISGPAWMTDPGIQTTDNQTTTAGRGRGLGDVVFSMPNLTRLGNAEVSQVADKLMDEANRRGIRTL